MRLRLLENGLPCLTKSGRIIFSLAVVQGVLVDLIKERRIEEVLRVIALLKDGAFA
jgi:hypothetical protein